MTIPRFRPTSLLLLMGTLFLAGCGSQIDSIDTPIVRPTTSAPEGIYTGVGTSRASGQSANVVALINAQRIYAFDSAGSLIAGGRYDAGTRSLNWRARAFPFDAQGRPLFNEPVDPEDEDEVPAPVIYTVTANGSFDPDIRILMDFSAGIEGRSGEIDSGTLTLNYAKTTYERRSDLPLLAGIWVNEDAFGTATSSFTIGQGGEVFGQQADNGCNYSGTVALIDQSRNLYSASLQIQCAGSGASRLESGLATLMRETTGDMLVIVTTGTATATLLRLNKA